MNRPVIEQFRKHDGRVPTRKSPILLLTSRGARTGRERVNPLNYSKDGERYVVMASKGGASTHPDWYHNLVAHPRVARVSSGTERARLLKIHTRAMPFFAAYERRVKRRQIPIITLEPFR
jgi:deazaflavin-dependent oxidoreductase (nitroreductase family)